jgi:peptidoglycan hydrolase-like protein with peptidoglycan-binding domain
VVRVLYPAAHSETPRGRSIAAGATLREAPGHGLRFTTVTAGKLVTLALTLAAIVPAGAALAGTPANPGGAARATPGASTAAGEATPTTPTPPARETPPPKPVLRTRVTSWPASSITDGTAPLRVRLSGAPVPGSPVPMLSPRIAGRWTSVGSAEYFKPKSTLEPCSTYTLTVWAGTTATGELPLGGRRRTLAMHVGCPPLRALQQALARLSYLPYTIDAAHGRNSGDKPEARALAARYAYHPPAARLLANVPHAPGLWYGALDPTTRGALIVFQSRHGLSPTGVPDRSTWASLLAAETLGHGDPAPYTFVTVSESIPETLEVHRGRHVVLSSPANTGVPGATTERGTFPIYARYVTTTMSGTNPDGSHYSDPGVPWVNYFNGGDAVHGFPRPSYGSPQSNGCVELPIAAAARVFPLLAIGDLVVVS